MRFIRDLVSTCVGLPMPLRFVLLMVVGGGSAAMLGYMLSMYIGRASWIAIGGIAVVVVLVLGFALLVKWMRKRKANPMERDILGQAASAPQGVSAASRRAALDDLRRNFETGIGKFRAAGKNLYSLPWYAIVGEPGSGKTEAIRHSCIGFPPGLHDPLQGAGGTINMNWWFTDRAVIIDTAGRLMFEEVPAGTTSEWQEFLKLLRTYRYNCPVNGLVLVIPADTLITDTADEIKRKANRIAEQLHLIQRILEVRFPVFVMITKCDLINGFREFFDNVTDPDLQQQMLGWSNPDPLDERFNPEQVSQHLEVVCDRLRRRRLGIMIDPMHTDDPGGHRIDQVDALYALPQSLSRIAPRLRHYLDHVFAGGEWTGKPLFLRGIYFTSSMREGHALDEELAEALGVPVQSVMEGREWERERSFFLKDLFLEKVFKERGLVTRAIHAGRQRRRRQAIVLFAGFFSVLILAALTWFGARALRGSIGIHRDYWVAAAKPQNWRPDEAGKGLEYWRPIVAVDFAGSSDYVYGGQTLVEVGGEEVRVAQFHSKLAELAERPIKVPWIFWFAKLGVDLMADRAAAQQLLLERSVVRPLVEAVRQKIALSDDPRTRKDVLAAGWPSEFTPALAEAVRLEAPDGQLPDQDGLNALFDCALYRRPEKEDNKAADERYKRYKDNFAQYVSDRDGLLAALKWMYGGRPDQERTLRVAAGGGTNEARWAIGGGVDRYIDYWKNQGKLATKQLGSIMDIRDALLKGYKDAEKRLLDTDEEFNPRLELPTENKKAVVGEALLAWEKRLADLSQVKGATEKKLAAFPAGPIYPVFEKNIGAIFENVAGEFAKFKRRAGIEQQPQPKPGEAAPAAEATPAPAKGEAADNWRRLAADVAGRLDKALEELKKVVPADVTEEIRRVDVEFLNQLELTKAFFERLANAKPPLVQAGASTKLRLYELRLAMYQLGDRERGKGDAPAEITSLGAGIKAVEDAVASACTQVTELKDLKPDAYRFKEASDVSVFTARQLAMPVRIYKILDVALSAVPDSPEKVGAQVEAAAQGPPALPALGRPRLPATEMNGGTFDPKYHPEAARKVMAICREAGQVLADPKRNILERDKLELKRILWQAVIGKYITGPYQTYWTQTVPRDLESHGKEWAPYRREIERADFFDVFVALGDVGARMVDALHSEIELSLPTDSRQAFAAARESVQGQIRKLKNEIYVQRCRTVRGNWCKLGDEPFKARTVLAPLANDEVFESYLPFESKNPEEFADKYWTGMTLEFLRLLAAGASEYGKMLVQDLRKGYSRFPLNRPVEKEKPLAATEVDEARKIVDALVIQWKETPSATAPGAGEARKFRDAVQAMIDEIRKLRIPAEDWDWVKKVKAVLDGLPTGDRALKCELWIPAVQPTPTAANKWVHIRILQTDKEIGKGSTLPAADYKLSDLWYPGEKLGIRLYRNPVETNPTRAFDVDNIWAMVRLLHPGAGEAADPLAPDKRFKVLWDAERPTEKKEVFDPVKRNVLVTIEDDQREPRLLRLRLEFEKGLPRIEDWPSSPAR